MIYRVKVFSGGRWFEKPPKELLPWETALGHARELGKFLPSVAVFNTKTGAMCACFSAPQFDRGIENAYGLPSDYQWGASCSATH